MKQKLGSQAPPNYFSEIFYYSSVAKKKDTTKAIIIYALIKNQSIGTSIILHVIKHPIKYTTIQNANGRAIKNPK